MKPRKIITIRLDCGKGCTLNDQAPGGIRRDHCPGEKFKIYLAESLRPIVSAFIMPVSGLFIIPVSLLIVLSCSTAELSLVLVSVFDSLLQANRAVVKHNNKTSFFIKCVFSYRHSSNYAAKPF